MTRLHFLLFFDIAVEAVAFIDLVINNHREFVHIISSFYLVISMLYIEHTNEASK